MRGRIVLGVLAAWALLGSGGAQIETPSPLAAGAEKFLGSTLTAKYDEPFAHLWNQVTPEDAGKWLSVEAQQGNMVWSVLDLVFTYARLHDLPVKAHTLVWGQQEPRWVAALPPDEQRAEVEEWMRAFGERYPDVAMVDVVNEPLHAPPSYAGALGGAGETGWDWVIWSFERARVHFPDAKLLINEYNILCCAAETARYTDLIALLQERGLIDGIGVQAHGLEGVDPAVVTAQLDTLAQLGLPIYVSELDIAASDDAEQLAIMQRLFPALWEHEAVAGITFWGYRAGETWKSNAYLVDWFDEPRPALTWLACYLAGVSGD